jgi:hypothetical protein
MRKLLLFLVVAGCGKNPEAAPAARPDDLPFQTLGAFEYADRMKLPDEVLKWNGKLVRVTGFMNPTTQARNLTTFLLVKDRGSCCFGKRPQYNHYIDVKLRPGLTANYSTDTVTVQGVLQVDDRWDGDWPMGLYWMKDAEVAR